MSWPLYLIPPLAVTWNAFLNPVGLCLLTNRVCWCAIWLTTEENGVVSKRKCFGIFGKIITLFLQEPVQKLTSCQKVSAPFKITLQSKFVIIIGLTFLDKCSICSNLFNPIYNVMGYLFSYSLSLIHFYSMNNDCTFFCQCSAEL